LIYGHRELQKKKNKGLKTRHLRAEIESGFISYATVTASFHEMKRRFMSTKSLHIPIKSRTDPARSALIGPTDRPDGYLDSDSKFLYRFAALNSSSRRLRAKFVLPSEPYR